MALSCRVTQQIAAAWSVCSSFQVDFGPSKHEEVQAGRLHAPYCKLVQHGRR
jgi:hypothetical protein